ncbi:MAG: thiamine pyrophosphate-dependent enzyme, partial [Alphaproteobacteria bacterium]|nr:thiamine pyrophosphate-dependent enzyme [Alphaproteobacteria bacterium]
DERHYLAQVHPAGNALWAECDVALSIGCRLQPERMYWGIDDDLKVIHVDIDSTELTRVMAPTIGIVGDSALVTAALVDAVPAHNPRRASREDELTALKASTHQHLVDGLGPQMAFLEVIRDELPEDGFFVDEFTQVGYVARVGFPVYRPRTMVTPGYQGTLGYGFATALGVAAAHPDKKVISVNGDGGFMYTMPELASAVHHNLDIVAIVFADGHYGNVRRQQKLEHDGKVIASDLTNPDFVKLAESFGALGLRADGPEGLRAALKQAFKQHGPAIIEVPVGEFTEPWPFIRPPASRPAR